MGESVFIVKASKEMKGYGLLNLTMQSIQIGVLEMVSMNTLVGCIFSK